MLDVLKELEDGVFQDERFRLFRERLLEMAAGRGKTNQDEAAWSRELHGVPATVDLGKLEVFLVKSYYEWWHEKEKSVAPCPLGMLKAERSGDNTLIILHFEAPSARDLFAALWPGAWRHGYLRDVTLAP